MDDMAYYASAGKKKAWPKKIWFENILFFYQGTARSENDELEFDPGTIEAGLGQQQQSALERLKRDQEVTRETFWDKMKFWEATKPRLEDIEEQIKVRRNKVVLIVGHINEIFPPD